MMDYEVINLGEYNLDSVFQLVMYQGDPRWPQVGDDWEYISNGDLNLY
jgi:hypothetical protein